MSTLFVANIGFESTDSNQIQYRDQTVTITTGGSNNIVANSSYITAKLFNTSITFSGTGTLYFGNGSAISNGSVTNLVTNGQINYSGNVTPTFLSASTADWNPLLGNSSVIRVSSNTAISLYGMVEGTNGQIVVLNNVGNSAINLSSEDSVNESTASRRFRLPADVVIYPTSSVSLIYDGVLSRWVGQNTIGTNFFHKQALTKGFFAGGQTPTAVATTDRTTHSTEATAAVPGANLSSVRYGPGAAGNACKGFFAGGGASPLFLATIDRTTHSTEATAAVPGANLSQGRSIVSAAGNACKGFFISGSVAAPTNAVATADRNTYSTETTAAVPGANLTQAKCALAAAGNACKGFFSGGQTALCVVSATSNRTTYSTETTAAVPGANLTQARRGIGAAGNLCKGFFIGGNLCGAPLTTTAATADRTTYSTEVTAAVPGANLSQARSFVSGAGNSCKGFFAGGYVPPIFVTTADRTTYSTEVTAAVPGANLSQARSSPGAI